MRQLGKRGILPRNFRTRSGTGVRQQGKRGNLPRNSHSRSGTGVRQPQKRRSFPEISTRVFKHTSPISKSTPSFTEIPARVSKPPRQYRALWAYRRPKVAPALAKATAPAGNGHKFRNVACRNFVGATNRPIIARSQIKFSQRRSRYAPSC